MDMDDQRRTETFNLRLTPEEAQLLRELARRLGVSMADVIRMAVREKHKMMGVGHADV